MGRNPPSILIVAIIGLLLAVTGQVGNAQEFHKEIEKSIFRAIRSDMTVAVAKSIAVELTKDEEFREQVVQQVARELIAAIGPANMKDIAKSVAAEVADAYRVKMRIDSWATANPDADSVRVVPASVAARLTKNPAAINTLASGGLVYSPQAHIRKLRDMMVGSDPMGMRLNQGGKSASTRFGRDLIAIITHPSNPIDTLTLDEVRKLFSGEYTNWSQVGGTDLPVSLITPVNTPAVLEAVLDTNLAPSAARVLFLSFLFVGVTENKGAVGFLLTHNMEQLEFAKGHGAIKKIYIKKDK